MNIKQKIGMRIKHFRELHKLTQFELSEKVDVSVETIYNSESGRKLSFPMIEKIAFELNIPVKELFDFGKLKNKNEELIKQIMILCNGRSENQLEFIRDFIHLVTKKM